MFLFRFAFGFTAMLLALHAAPAGAEEVKTGYTVSYLGLPVAHSNFVSTFDGDRFTIKGTLSSSGIARLFDATDGKMRVSGSLADGKVQPDLYVLSYTSGSKKKRTVLHFADDAVSKTENVPPLKGHKKKWIELSPDDLKAVSDPLSATLLPAARPGDVCRRTIRVFDGEMRADVKLSPAAGPSADWYGLKTVTCQARFEPVAGYKKGKEAIEYLRDKSQIAITYAPMAKLAVYAPVHASVGTQIGTISVSADAPFLQRRVTRFRFP